VQAVGGQRGFVAAWLVHLTGQNLPASGLVVVPGAPVNVCARPGEEENVLTVALPEDNLAVLGDKAQAEARIGKQGEWLNVRTPQKYAGYVAAWQVHLPGEGEPAAPITELVVFANDAVNMRAQPSANSPRVGGIFRGGQLVVIETDLKAARAKVGKEGMWIFGENKEGERGWVAAWFLTSAPV